MKLVEDITGYILVPDNHKTAARVQDDPEAVEAYMVAKPVINRFWSELNSGAKVTCCEVVVGEHRFKVCAAMPEHIYAYMDYVEPQEEPKPVPVEQFINRRISDGALWPTMFPITSEGWEQIGFVDLNGRHEVGDTVLVYDHYPKPVESMRHAKVDNLYHRPEGKIWVVDLQDLTPVYSEVCINFSKGDHLSEQERDAWQAEAYGQY